MTTRTVDVAVIGAGTAGLAAYRAARAEGKTTVIIEAGPYGTTCARVGCMPSKLLIAAGDAAHHAADAGPFGVTATVKVDGKVVMDRVKRERDRFVGFVVDGMRNVREEDRIRGRAAFVAPSTLSVALEQGGTEKVVAKAIVLATGSHPRLPPIFDGVKDRVLVNDDVFAWDDLPASVAVFGTGVIGLELGQALSRLGVRVRVFGKGDNVAGLTDPVVKEAARTALSAELAVDFDAKIASITPEGARGVRVAYERDGRPQTEAFDAILVAAGRRPNLHGIGLETAGVDLGAPIDRHTSRWGTSNVFVAGDASDDVPLLHEAADEGAIAGRNAAHFPHAKPGQRRSFIAVAFTDPQVAIAGARFADLAGREIAVGYVDFVDQGRSRMMRQNRGAMRVYADRRSRAFLGAEIAHPRAEHLAHLLAWAHQSALTIDQMLAMPFYHPVVEEGLRTALRDVRTKLDAAPEK